MDLRGTTVLLVDDDAGIRSTLARLLTRAGAHVELACNGLEAVQAMEHLRPDGVLMDVNMPKMSGLEAAARIRTASQLTCMVLMSARDASREAARIGVPFVSKDDLDDVLRTFTGAVASACERRVVTVAPAGPLPSRTSPPGPGVGRPATIAHYNGRLRSMS